MRYNLLAFRAEAKHYGLRRAVHNFVWNTRFDLGYRIGGFTKAYRAR